MTVADDLQAAIDAASSAGGGVVVVPPGRHEVGTYRGLELRSHVSLVGSPGALLVREGVCATVVSAESVRDVSVRDLCVDINRTKNYQTALSFLDCERVRIADCDLQSSVIAPVGDTIHAVLAQRTNDLEVRDTYARGAQIKIAGAGGGRRLAVRRCRIDEARNCGVSAVLMYDTDVLDDVVIEDVHVSGYGNAGVFVGSDDGYAAVGAVHGLRVRRCRVGGRTEGSGSVGVLVRLGRDCSDWEFSDLRITPEWTTTLQTSMGFAIVADDQGIARGRDVRIRNLRQVGRAYVGVEVRGAIDQLTVRDVHADSRVRLFAHAGSLTGVRLRDVRATVERAGSHQVVLDEYAP